MPTGSIPSVGTRVSVTMYAGDLLAHQHLVSVETYSGAGFVSALFNDGAGVRLAISGDRSSVRMVLSAALAQLGPSDQEGAPDGS